MVGLSLGRVCAFLFPAQVWFTGLSLKEWVNSGVHNCMDGETSIYSSVIVLYSKAGYISTGTNKYPSVQSLGGGRPVLSCKHMGWSMP